MMRSTFIGVLLGLMTISNLFAQVQIRQQMELMGSRFSITVLAEDSLQGGKYIDTAVHEISRIEDLISEWREGTEVSRINQLAGQKPLKVSAELLQLTENALNFSRRSQGAFDISIAALDAVWRFDGSMEEVPSKKSIRRSVANVGYKGILVDIQKSEIYLKRKGMKIGFGSIGKGYAADQARGLLIRLGVKGGLIDASGDIAAWGKQLNGEAWKIGIFNPLAQNASERIAQVLQVDKKCASVATSGSYQKNVEFDGIRYSHIINPKTGYPARGLISVTVYGQSAEVANGISTSIMVLGEQKAAAFLQQFPSYRAILICDDGRVVNL